MKIVVIGAGGDVGRSVADELARDGKHDVIRVGRTRGDHQVDITLDDSVSALFEQIGPVDAIVAAAGNEGPRPNLRDRAGVASADTKLQRKSGFLAPVRLLLCRMVGQCTSPHHNNPRPSRPPP